MDNEGFWGFIIGFFLAFVIIAVLWTPNWQIENHMACQYAGGVYQSPDNKPFDCVKPEVDSLGVTHYISVDYSRYKLQGK